MERLAVGELNLRRAWESSQRSTVEDWFEWMRYFSVELLRESPSPALRATAPLAQVLQPSRCLMSSAQTFCAFLSGIRQGCFALCLLMCCTVVTCCRLGECRCSR